MKVQPVTLSGSLVHLEPLQPEHHDGLVAAAQDGELWQLWYTSVPEPSGMAAEIERRLHFQETGQMVPFTARRLKDDRIIGMTSLMNIDQALPRVEIGSTWNAASSHGSGTNAESKLLLLTHAFEELGCPAVELRTHWLNAQSRAAIERLGARLDGILRSHTRAKDGTLRDTCVYSIVASEWPAVRSGLEFRLNRHQQQT
ncbi:GNAT family N-acetyltransferase [Deinococcus radiophilus]|uniref:N-acetyltransferase n=1 Tax=Deinococcus radiophilus TaxID=32062 RepID=A0A431VI63_9DEIO|nr:GNAT family protein [Deinococcus radiophilus]RTR19927.1 N-acetyltransferase [Deinococcus radiophilus]UFA50969.1 GNAT family N-acetyltransferase [Deinococcus radiophilus]